MNPLNQYRRKIRGEIVCLGLVLATGCAHTRPGAESHLAAQPVSQNEPRTVAEVIQRAEGSRSSDSAVLVVKGVRLQNSQFDFPVVVNTRVEFWVDYFTGRGRKYFEKYLERSELFVPYITPILRQNAMPEDLVYLAMIESGFNNHARSHAKAVGPWQFISATGKRYGLMVNWWVDERRDTRKSTMAAVEYLKDLYQMFQSWELAAAAYNAGEAKVARAIRRFGTSDFWTISKHRFLRPETRDYVPKIMAAAIVAKNRTQFGFPPPGAGGGPSDGELIAGDGEVVRVEKESSDQAAEAEIASVSEVIKTAQAAPPRWVSTPSVSKSGSLSGEQVLEFEVQGPADLLQVAHAAGLSYATVKSLNPELLRWCTPPHLSSYRIKLPASTKDQFLVKYNQPDFPKKVQFMAYKVRGGETIGKIARHFGIRHEPIVDLNGISPTASLHRGAKIFLPMPLDRTRSLASLEIRDPPRRRVSKRSPRKRSAVHKIGVQQREAARISGRKHDQDS